MKTKFKGPAKPTTFISLPKSKNAKKQTEKDLFKILTEYYFKNGEDVFETDFFSDEGLLS